MLNELNASVTLIILQTQSHARFLMAILCVLWILFFLSQATGNRLLAFGIVPRQLYGLPGILFAPFLHANFNHLFFNSIPLLILSDFLLMHGLPYFLYATFYIILISGSLIWCFARSGLYIGASAVITGYWALLVSGIYQEGTLTAFILGGLSLYYFAGIFLGIFPQKKGVSWEGHLFGLLAGLATSFLFKSGHI